eukprot:2989669-Rhodomonas_salina.1
MNRCCLLELPSAVLGMYWPAERVMAGLRVCKSIRKELLEHTGTIIVAKTPGASVGTDLFAADFWQERRRKVCLTWRGEPHLLQYLEPLAPCLSHLDVKDTVLGGIGVRGLAKVVRTCTVLRHLDLSGAGIDHDGMERLAGRLG